MHNIRVFQNRGLNAFHDASSCQPIFGGPVYFFRNLLYHVPSGVAFRLDTGPAGILIFHNSIVGEQAVRSPAANIHWRNSLIFGRHTPGRGVMYWGNAASQPSSDYSGFRPNRNADEQYQWLAPSKPAETAYRAGRDQWRSIRTWDEFRAACGQETHGVELDFDIFESMTRLDPSKRHAVYHAMDLNFRLRPGSKAVDAGVVLPTVNEDFTGSSPGLGVLEHGRAEPDYGPR